MLTAGEKQDFEPFERELVGKVGDDSEFVSFIEFELDFGLDFVPIVQNNKYRLR